LKFFYLKSIDNIELFPFDHCSVVFTTSDQRVLRFLVIVVIQSTFEKPYLTNVHMEQNSQSVSAFQYLS
jgi:hypothetical protein